jgi:hypothetical protein
MNIPEYHARRKRGELLPHTAFKQTELLSVDHIGFSKYNYKGTQWYENINFPVDDSIIIRHAADTSAGSSFVQEAAAAINGAGYDAATSLAEAKQTARMVTGINRKVGRFLNDLADLKKGRIDMKKFFRKTPKELHKAWLEGRYGWRTLAFDARDLYEAVYEFSSKRKIWTERRGFTYTDRDPILVTEKNWGAAAGITRREISVETEHSIRGAVAALTDVSRFQFNPLNTAWELIPMSFVIDFSLQVGEAIQALSLVHSAKATTASIGFRSETRYSRTDSLVAIPGNGWTYTMSQPGIFKYVFASTVREPSSIPLLPQVGTGFWDAAKLLDMQALYRARGHYR